MLTKSANATRLFREKPCAMRAPKLAAGVRAVAAPVASKLWLEALEDGDPSS